MLQEINNLTMLEKKLAFFVIKSQKLGCVFSPDGSGDPEEQIWREKSNENHSDEDGRCWGNRLVHQSPRFVPDGPTLEDAAKASADRLSRATTSPRSR